MLSTRSSGNDDLSSADGDNIARRAAYAFLLSEAHRPGASGTPPPAPVLFTTYHPLLVKSHYSTQCYSACSCLATLRRCSVRSPALPQLSAVSRVIRSFKPLCRWHKWSLSRRWSGRQAAGALACSPIRVLSSGQGMSSSSRPASYPGPENARNEKLTIEALPMRFPLCPYSPSPTPVEATLHLSLGQGHCLTHSRPRCHPLPHTPRPHHLPRQQPAPCLCPRPRFLVSSASSRFSLDYGSDYPRTRPKVAARVRNRMSLRSGSFCPRRPRVRLPPTVMAWGTKKSQRPLPINVPLHGPCVEAVLARLVAVWPVMWWACFTTRIVTPMPFGC
jgi:hypothetical protein